MKKLFDELEKHKSDPFVRVLIRLWLSERDLEKENDRLIKSMQIDEISGNPFYFEEDDIVERVYPLSKSFKKEESEWQLIIGGMKKLINF